ILQILDSAKPFYAMGLIIGICLIHSYVELGENKKKSVYDNIAKGLAEDYAAMYYIDTETGEYQEYVASEEYKSMNVPVIGRDFYAETQANIDAYVHPDDRELARSLHHKETMLANLEGRKSYSYKYRLMVNGQPRIFLFTIKLANDGRNLVLYEKDIEDDIRAELQRQEAEKKQVTFTQIAESLAVNYDVIYYVNAEDADYISFECQNIYGQMDMKQRGDDFFADCQNDILQIVHRNDRETVMDFLKKENLEKALDTYKSSSIDYRIMNGNKAHYVRLTVRKTSDDSHYIIGVENVDDEILKEKQHLKALLTEKELARRDELTGVKNKNAYHELQKSIQENIEHGLDYLTFALVVCDANNLKQINDTEGHVAGDEYIKSSSKLLCDIFVHSPVFRVGGDEFVVFLRSEDFTNREELMKTLRDRVEENVRTGKRPILASGMAEYIPTTDSLVSDIFDRADKEMYENKQKLKQAEAIATLQ
ncbi:MAG: diguanylate cyclase, partial [Lachnospiraceae bacterium]|nr:diguanylate cyclase [Lachnospiraceae bacterium]